MGPDSVAAACTVAVLARTRSGLWNATPGEVRGLLNGMSPELPSRLPCAAGPGGTSAVTWAAVVLATLGSVYRVRCQPCVGTFVADAVLFAVLARRV
jgi:hypothetical protein